MGEELERLLDRHLEHVGDRLALEADLERLAVVALAVALLARHVDVGQEVHLDLDLPVAAAHLAAAALDVEREAARLVAARPRLLGLGEQLADLVEQPDVGGRVGARRAADRRLVDRDDLVELLEAGDPPVHPGALPRSVQPVGDRLVEHLVDQRRLARARHPGDAAHHAERDLHVDVLEVVLRGALDLDVARRPAPPLGHLDRPRPGQELAGQRSGTRATSSAVPWATTWPPCSPAPGPCRRDGRRRASCPRRARPRARCCRGRAAARASRSASRCRAGAGRSTARRGCRARRPATSRSGWPAGSAGPRRPTASTAARSIDR